MNAFDSKHSLDYRDDLLESNPFADSPSRSTELNINTSFISSDNEPPVFEAEQEEESEQEEITEVQMPEEENAQEEEQVDTHQGERVLSPMSTVNQLEALILESSSQEELVDTDTQVSKKKKKKKKNLPGIFLVMNNSSQNLYKCLKVAPDLISRSR